MAVDVHPALHSPEPRRPTVPRWALPSGLALVLVALLADAAFRNRGEFDYRLLRAVHRIDFAGLEPALRFFSTLTGSFWAITFWAGLLILFVATRRWLAAVSLGAFPVVGGINFVIRDLIGRSRPDRLPSSTHGTTMTSAATVRVRSRSLVSLYKRSTASSCPITHCQAGRTPAPSTRLSASAGYGSF